MKMKMRERYVIADIYLLDNNNRCWPFEYFF